MKMAVAVARSFKGRGIYQARKVIEWGMVVEVEVDRGGKARVFCQNQELVQ